LARQIIIVLENPFLIVTASKSLVSVEWLLHTTTSSLKSVPTRTGFVRSEWYGIHQSHYVDN